MDANLTPKLVNVYVRDLPPLHEYVLQHKEVLTEITYPLKISAAISHSGIHLSVLSAPILVADTNKGKFTIGGFRSWSLCQLKLNDNEKVPVIELKNIDEKTIKTLSICGVFAAPLICTPEKPAVTLVAGALDKLSQDERAIFSSLVPGAATKQKLSKNSGIREGTIYERKRRDALPDQSIDDGNSDD